MLSYSTPVSKYVTANDYRVPSFTREGNQNIDWKTVTDFGHEWLKFNRFSDHEIQQIGKDYFDIVTDEMLNRSTLVLDVGCGSGRWSKYMAGKAKFVEAVDPSSAVIAASVLLKDTENVRVTQASVDEIPFADESFDFVTSLGVLHHIPDTRAAMASCLRKLKKNGWFHVYLYYSLDNRGLFFRSLFKLVNFTRAVISSLPAVPKNVVCDLLAAFIYLPLSRLSRLLVRMGLPLTTIQCIPLSYYRDKTLFVLRNDSRDRFGTRLEHRFSKDQIRKMMEELGLKNVVFSDREPYWHAVGQKT